MDLQTALDEYRYSVLDLSSKTQVWYDQKLRTFVDWCQGEHEKNQKKATPIQLEQVQPSMVGKFLDEYRNTPTERFGRPPSSYTVKGYAQVIKGFLNWAGREDLIAESIGRRIKVPRADEKVIEIFSPEQIKRLFAACRQEPYINLQYRDRAMLAVLLGTGIRAGELCSLTLDRIFVNSRDPKDSYIRVKGKGRKEREIGLPPSAVEHLMKYVRRYREAGQWINAAFVGRKRAAMTPSGLDQWMDRLGSSAGIAGVRCSPHTLRHTFAVNFLLARGDIYLLSRILGHSDIKTTEIYLRAVKQHQIRKASFSVLDLISERR